MRFIYPILIVGVLAIVILTMVSSNSTGSSKETAEKFLEAIQKGDYKGTVELFGGNTCRCPKKGGWVSYLVYASAQEPNLAFMMGRPFFFGGLTQTPIQHPDKAHVTLLPWQQPEDVIVDVIVSFDPERYCPYFLPLKMAYGMPISEGELSKFALEPDTECWKGFALRLRPSIAPGAIDRPESSKGIDYKPTEKLDDVNRAESLSMEDKQKLIVVQTKGKTIPLADLKKKSSANVNPSKKTDDSEDKDDSFIYANVEDAIRETLGEEVAAYLHPRDAGPVKKTDGTQMSEVEIEKKLPRLLSAKLRLHIVRREQLKSWTVYHMSILDPVVLFPDGKSRRLSDYRPPSNDEVPNPEASAPEANAPAP